jgi:hypothetical protein
MPAYNTIAPAPALNPGQQQLAFNTENPATGALSQQFEVLGTERNTIPALSVEISFAAAPGAFSFTVMEADTDLQGNYIEVGTDAVTTVNTSNVARIDVPQFIGTFISIQCTTANANAVNATVKISRKC